jgi:outer membrane receptor for ferric coprogen and ferric-rhodotorulic acid
MSRSSFALAPVALAVLALVATSLAHAQNSERPAAAHTDSAAATAPNTPLPPVTVRATQDRASTEGTERYNSTQATVGKAAADLKEIPQSISVVTQQRMEDQNMRNVEEVLEQTVGYVSERFDSESASYASRGFAINNYMIDGVPAPGTAAAWDSVLFDRVELLRGPSALFSGVSSSGGAINLVRKRPQDTFQVRSAVQLGSWSTKRAEVDVTGPLNQAGTVLGRFSAAKQDGSTYQSGAQRDRYAVAGSLDFKLAPSTSLLVGAHAQKVDGWLTGGLPSYTTGALLDVPRSTWLGADWNRSEQDEKYLYAELSHRFNDDWRARLHWSGYRNDQSTNYLYLPNGQVTPTNGKTSLMLWFNQNRIEQNVLDANLTGHFQAFGRRHDVVVGADWRRNTIAATSGRYANYYVQDVYAPDHSAVPYLDRPATARSQSETSQYGVYGQTRMRLADPLTVVLGARVSWYDTQSRNLLPTTGAWTTTQVDHKLSPYAGLTYAFTPQVSGYVSYSDAFTPQTQLSFGGGVIDPIVGKQLEVGIKGEFFDRTLSTNAAVYRIREVNRAQADPINTGFSVAQGEVESKGVELEVSGRLTKQWNVYAGYAYNENRYVRDVASAGLPLNALTPHHSVKLWSQYRFGEGVLEGLSIGAGVNAYSSASGGNGVTNTHRPGFGVVNAAISYRIDEHWSVALNLNNVTDKVYWQRVYTTGRSNFFGEPRNASVTVRANF